MRAGFTADFIGLPDGLPGAARRPTGWRRRAVSALAPAVKYQALVAGDVDIIDAYSTDGLLDRYPLTVLDDDRRVLPALRRRGDGARRAGAASSPAAVAALAELSGRLDVTRMRRLNARVEVNGEHVAVVARDALAELGLDARAGAASRRPTADRPERRARSLAAYLWQRRVGDRRDERCVTCWLAGVSLAAAIVVGVRSGWRSRRAPLGRAGDARRRRAADRARASRCWRSCCRCSASASCRRWWRCSSTRSIRSCATR